jgi:hypothetical protein
MMMMSTIDKTSILARIAGDKRQVGAKIAKELETAEIVFSDKKSEKNEIISRSTDADGKTVITFYEGNIGTANKEAIAAYYLSLEGAKMLIAEKSTVTDKASLDTNAECLIAANEVAFGIANATETSASGKTQLANVRKDIDKEISSKQKPASGNSDAVEVLSSMGIKGLDSVEARAKKLNAKEITSTGSGTTKETTVKTESTSADGESTTSATSTASSSTSKIATPRSVLTSDNSSSSSSSASKDKELVNIGNGQTMTRKEAKVALKSQFSSFSDAQLNEMVAKMPTVSAISLASNTASATDRFNINGVMMTREQATTGLLSTMPTLQPAQIEQVLATYKVAGGAGTVNPTVNPNEMVEFMGQKLPRTLASTLAKQLFPTMPEAQLNALFKPVTPTPSLTNPLLGTSSAMGLPNPMLTTGYNPALLGSTQPRSAMDMIYNNNPSVFATMPTQNPQLGGGSFPNMMMGTSSSGRTPSGLQIVKAGV